MNQPALSKLTDKLVAAGFVVRQSARGDGRACRTRTTARGRAFLADLDRALAAALPARESRRSLRVRRRRAIPTASGQLYFDLSRE